MLLREAKELLRKNGYYLHEAKSSDVPVLVKDHELAVGDILERYNPRNYQPTWKSFLRVEEIKNGQVRLSKCGYFEYDAKRIYEADIDFGYSMGTYGRPIFAPAIKISYTIENPKFKNTNSWYKIYRNELYDCTNSSRGKATGDLVKLIDKIPVGEKILWGVLSDSDDVNRIVGEHPKLRDDLDAKMEELKNKHRA